MTAAATCPARAPGTRAERGTAFAAGTADATSPAVTAVVAVEARTSAGPGNARTAVSPRTAGTTGATVTRSGATRPSGASGAAVSTGVTVRSRARHGSGGLPFAARTPSTTSADRAGIATITATTAVPARSDRVGTRATHTAVAAGGRGGPRRAEG